ncbi:hypothetical protein MHBO_001415 [Bonamia ostreae]|uniref:Uncharacterized protein n=1 Tax=Bonamia ostreae TaxID=126728 RepID=A0ABV2AJ14_9EUKA
MMEEDNSSAESKSLKTTDSYDKSLLDAVSTINEDLKKLIFGVSSEDKTEKPIKNNPFGALNYSASPKKLVNNSEKFDKYAIKYDENGFDKSGKNENFAFEDKPIMFKRHSFKKMNNLILENDNYNQNLDNHNLFKNGQKSINKNFIKNGQNLDNQNFIKNGQNLENQNLFKNGQKSINKNFIKNGQNLDNQNFIKNGQNQIDKNLFKTEKTKSLLRSPFVSPLAPASLRTAPYSSMFWGADYNVTESLKEQKSSKEELKNGSLNVGPYKSMFWGENYNVPEKKDRTEILRENGLKERFGNIEKVPEKAIGKSKEKGEMESVGDSVTGNFVNGAIYDNSKLQSFFCFSIFRYLQFFVLHFLEFFTIFWNFLQFCKFCIFLLIFTIF